jgi:hypothetical protein
MPLPDWLPKPHAKDQWKTVEAVRSEAVSSLIKESVVSQNAVAVRLHTEEHH